MPETKSVAGGAQGTLVETRGITGGVPVPSLTLVQADQVTILGDGSHERPLQAGPAGELGSYVVVYRPGGTAEENVAVTWAQALEMLGKLQGERILQFDDSLTTPIVIPLGSYEMTNVVWSGSSGGVGSPVVQVNQGVTFTGLRRFDQRVQVVFTGTTPPVSDFDVSGSVPDTIALDHGARITASGTGPFFRLTLAGGVGIAVNLSGGSAFATGSHSILDLAAGALAGVTVEGAGSDLQSSTLSGVGGSALSLLVGSSGIADASEDQPFLAGAFLLGNATQLRRFPTPVLTSDTPLTEASQLVRVDPSLGPLTLTLPPAVGHRGQSVSVKNVTSSANGVTIAAAGGDTIDGAASVALASGHFFFELTSDGVSQWLVTGQVGTSVSLQVFSYTVTGLEPDPSVITIVLPLPMSSTNYGVVMACQGVAGIASFDVTDKTTTQFKIDATGNLNEADKIVFFVSAFT